MKIAADRRVSFAAWLGLALALAGCGSTVDFAPAASGESTYELVPPGGSVPVGGMNNVAFSVDLDTPLRFYPDGKSDLAFISSFDFTRCDNVTALEMFAGNLEPGDSAWVGHVDLEIMALTPEKKPSWTGWACIGVRTVDAWEWSVEKVPLKYDPVTDLLRARIPIERGPIDAVKVAFDVEHSRPMARIMYTARPDTAEP